MKKQFVFYVAGPFRGADSWAMEQNIRRAEEVAWCIFAEGEVAICPHTNTRFFQGSLPDQVWIDGTLTMMRVCDAVIVVPGWEQSVGTLGEIAEAERLGMPVFCVKGDWTTQNIRRCVRDAVAELEETLGRAA